MFDGVAHLRDFGERQRRRFFTERRLLARRRGDDLLAMHVGRRHDHDRIDGLVVDQRERIGIRLRDVKLFRDLLGEVADRIGDGDEPRFRNPSRQVARVHPAEAAEANHSYVQSFHREPDAFVTISSFTMMSGGSVLAVHHFHRAFDRRLAHLVRKLRHRRVHGSRRDRLLRIIQRVEPDDADLSGLSARGDRLDRAKGHQVARGKHRVDVRVRLQHVLEDVEALIALPVCRL